YFWAFRLGGRTWAWITAWLNMVGQVTITAGINVAAATYLIGAVTRVAGASPDVAVPLFGSATSWCFQLTVMAVRALPQVLSNAFGMRLSVLRNVLAVWCDIAGAIVMVCLLVFSGMHHNRLAFSSSRVTPVRPRAAAAVDLGGHTGRALVIADLTV